ncbi:hypothetical protein HanRHA438_Chr13g0608781 [Helianthus annuus]|nr:hypothetical protein HanRHA438_Chr13g0608781 [Helianthus annuus]
MSRFFNFIITYFDCNEITGGNGLEPNLVYMFSAAFSLFDKLNKNYFLIVTRKFQHRLQKTNNLIKLQIVMQNCQYIYKILNRANEAITTKIHQIGLCYRTRAIYK